LSVIKYSFMLHRYLYFLRDVVQDYNSFVETELDEETKKACLHRDFQALLRHKYEDKFLEFDATTCRDKSDLTFVLLFKPTNKNHYFALETLLVYISKHYKDPIVYLIENAEHSMYRKVLASKYPDVVYLHMASNNPYAKTYLVKRVLGLITTPLVVVQNTSTILPANALPVLKDRIIDKGVSMLRPAEYTYRLTMLNNVLMFQKKLYEDERLDIHEYFATNPNQFTIGTTMYDHSIGCYSTAFYKKHIGTIDSRNVERLPEDTKLVQISAQLN